MKGLQNKVAIVTGGASGLGKATAERFVAEGVKVLIADIQEEAGQQIAAAHEGVAFKQVDVSDPEQVEAMVAEVVERFGRLDILFNNAGIDGAQRVTHNSSLDNWKKVIAINLDGVYYGMKYGIAQMMVQGEGGVVINTASTAGLVGFGGIPPYSASKGAVVQLTRSTAIEYAKHNIRVNSIAPTVVKTALVEHFIQNSGDPEATEQQFGNLNPMPGWVQPADIAAAVAFLASDEARFITGHTLPIDGGYTAR